MDRSWFAVLGTHTACMYVLASLEGNKLAMALPPCVITTATISDSR